MPQTPLRVSLENTINLFKNDELHLPFDYNSLSKLVAIKISKIWVLELYFIHKQLIYVKLINIFNIIWYFQARNLLG